MSEHYSIVMARKPLSEKTVALNVMKWGTGGINIDESRVEYQSKADEKSSIPGSLNSNQKNSLFGMGEGHKHNTQGRFPANIIFDEEAGKILDKQSGITYSGPTNQKVKYGGGIFGGGNGKVYEANSGGASRFFYKALTEQEYEQQEINKIENMNKVTLLKGDCIKKLKGLKDNSVDSVVTDPPYEIGFMGKGWDDSGIANNPKLWKEVLRVLKPGGHLLSFSHSRTYHRQAVAVEDAGFEIRDQIMWIYGSGFPKSHNIGKSVDKLLGNEREDIGLHERQNYKKGGAGFRQLGNDELKTDYRLTKGQSQYEGWGTALKPAHEPIVMARKPLSEKTVAKNVLEYGTGGINIDGCRVGSEEHSYSINGNIKSGNFGNGANQPAEEREHKTVEGRFPANIILDEEAGKILDAQSGTSKSGIRKGGKGGSGIYEGAFGDGAIGGYNDTGGASRFFYCPKASKKDRNDGIEHLQPKSNGKIGTTFAGNQTTSKIGANPNKPTEPQQNVHPTVKPTDLMAYLVRLVTPKGGVVLDPFMGSGSTGKASVREGFDFIGIEREKEYMKIAKTRIEAERKKHNYRTFFHAV